jgi:hypothetical protein
MMGLSTIHPSHIHDDPLWMRERVSDKEARNHPTHKNKKWYKLVEIQINK